MRKLIICVLLALVCAPLATAQETCTWCEFAVQLESRVHHGRKVFCGEDCRAEYHADSFRCKICNDLTDPPSTPKVRNDGQFIYIQVSAPKWDGYCDYCREGVKDGSIDPIKDRYVAPVEDRPAKPGGAAAPPPVAPGEDPEAKEEVDVLGYAKWVIGIGVGLFFVIRFLFK